MKEFGTNRIIGNKRIITLRYTDMELSSRVVKFLHRLNPCVPFVTRAHYFPTDGRHRLPRVIESGDEPRPTV